MTNPASDPMIELRANYLTAKRNSHHQDPILGALGGVIDEGGGEEDGEEMAVELDASISANSGEGETLLMQSIDNPPAGGLREEAATGAAEKRKKRKRTIDEVGEEKDDNEGAEEQAGMPILPSPREIGFDSTFGGRKNNSQSAQVPDMKSARDVSILAVCVSKALIVE